ncbi:MAG: DUF4294 domain-containing protein [Vicingaceae bacterium]|nr:DUF4294 domain-containing protein [Vicingaceae bacterium]
MNSFKNILFSFLILSIPLSLFSQNKKEAKKDSLIHILRNDSLRRVAKQLQADPKDTNNPTESSFQVIENQLYKGQVVQVLILNGDTTYLFNLNDFRVVDLMPYGDIEKDKKFKRLQYHVTKVYPYAKVAATKLNAYNEELLKVKSKKQRRKLLKEREQQLREEFTDVIKKMTVTQGRILTKLIDRETGESTYEIIKEMRGGFKAFIYQGVARIYDGDLKTRYDPKNNEEDEMIERIVLNLEAKQ